MPLAAYVVWCVACGVGRAAHVALCVCVCVLCVPYMALAIMTIMAPAALDHAHAGRIAEMGCLFPSMIGVL